MIEVHAFIQSFILRVDNLFPNDVITLLMNNLYYYTKKNDFAERSEILLNSNLQKIILLKIRTGWLEYQNLLQHYSSFFSF